MFPCLLCEEDQPGTLQQHMFIHEIPHSTSIDSLTIVSGGIRILVQSSESVKRVGRATTEHMRSR